MRQIPLFLHNSNVHMLVPAVSRCESGLKLVMWRYVQGTKRLVGWDLFFTLSVMLLLLPAGAQVRAPRDTPIIIHGRVQPTRAVEPSRYVPTQVRPPDFILRQAPSPPIRVEKNT